jgi:hypothetical protein
MRVHRLLIERILSLQDRCWRDIEAGIRAGEPAMRRLHEAGAVAAVRADFAWTTRHRQDLEAALC